MTAMIFYQNYVQNIYEMKAHVISSMYKAIKALFLTLSLMIQENLKDRFATQCTHDRLVAVHSVVHCSHSMCRYCDVIQILL